MSSEYRENSNEGVVLENGSSQPGTAVDSGRFAVWRKFNTWLDSLGNIGTTAVLTVPVCIALAPPVWGGAVAVKSRETLRQQQRLEEQAAGEAAAAEQAANIRFQSDLAQQVVDEFETLPGSDTVRWDVEMQAQNGGTLDGQYLMGDGRTLSEKNGTFRIAEQATLQLLERRAQAGEAYSFDPSSIQVTEVVPGENLSFTVNVTYAFEE